MTFVADPADLEGVRASCRDVDMICQYCGHRWGEHGGDECPHEWRCNARPTQFLITLTKLGSDGAYAKLVCWAADADHAFATAFELTSSPHYMAYGGPKQTCVDVVYTGTEE